MYIISNKRTIEITNETLKKAIYDEFFRYWSNVNPQTEVKLDDLSRFRMIISTLKSKSTSFINQMLGNDKEAKEALTILEEILKVFENDSDFVIKQDE